MPRLRYCRKLPEHVAPALGGTDDAPELEGGTRKKARGRVGGAFGLESGAFGLEAVDDALVLEDPRPVTFGKTRRRGGNTFWIRPTAGYQLRHLDGASSFNVAGFMECDGAIAFREGARTAGVLVADLAFVNQMSSKGTKDRLYKCRLR